MLSHFEVNHVVYFAFFVTPLYEMSHGFVSYKHQGVFVSVVIVALSRGPSVPGVTRVARVVCCVSLGVRSMMIGFVVSFLSSVSFVVDPADEG